eukprot:1107567-Karenia_brevis.AAC.1
MLCFTVLQLVSASLAQRAFQGLEVFAVMVHGLRSGCGAAVAYHAAASVMAEMHTSYCVDIHIERCRWLTAFAVFASMLPQEGFAVAAGISLYVFYLPADSL